MMILTLVSCIHQLQSNKLQNTEIVQKEHFFEMHGDQRADSYAWLMKKHDPEIKQIVEQQNQKTAQKQQAYQEFTQNVISEMLSRLDSETPNILIKKGEWVFQVDETSEYPILRRKKIGDTDFTTILDQNELAKEKSYFHLHSWKMSPNGRYLAYSIDTKGDEQYQIVVKDLDTGDVLPQNIEQTEGSIVWQNNTSFFYVLQDQDGMEKELWLKMLDQADPQKTWEETEASASLVLSESKSGRYVFLTSKSKKGYQVLFLDTDKERGEWQTAWERKDGVKVWPFHFQDQIVLRTNDQASNYRLISIDPSQPNSPQEFWPEAENIRLQGVDAFVDFLVLWEKESRGYFLRIVRKDGSNYRIAFPEAGFVLEPEQNLDYEAKEYIVGYSSMVSPKAIYSYNVDQDKLSLLSQIEIADYNPAHYQQKEITVPSKDGTPIPMTLLFHNDLDLSTAQPSYIYAYGSYGWALDRDFSSYRVSLVERGVLYAYCHARGGGFQGEEWYLAGTGSNRQTAIDDMVACAKGLQDLGYTSPEKTAISAESAGGTLVGGALNQAPELFAVAIMDRPFVDVITVLSDQENSINEEEWLEWGNPKEKEIYQAMKQYSPYDNIQKQDYPDILVTAGWNDPYVSYWEPLKWVAKLQQYDTKKSDILLQTDMNAGHTGGQSKQDIAESYAQGYVFAMQYLGITVDSKCSDLPRKD